MRPYGWEVPYAKQSQFAVGTAHPHAGGGRGIVRNKANLSDRAEVRLRSRAETA